MPPSKALFDGSKIAFVGSYLPRHCGIATFTHDLCEAVATQASEQDVFTVAMNDIPEGYAYPPRVRFEIRQNVQSDYRLAAEFLNINQVSAICLQHEYGIYGGTCGSHLLSMLRRVRRPLVTTLHTILREPNEQQKLVLQETCRISGRIVVMADIAREFLKDIYEVSGEKIAVIPHGIPDVPFVDPHFFKDQFGVEGRRVVLTFGLLSPGKGIEYVIEALPDVVQKHPDVVYILLGATHPHVKAESGEEYRNSLMRRAHELGLRDHVIFVNRFVDYKELCEYLGAADLYVTPYLNEAQITSGTLAYAAGAGKAVISTPYWHAEELLADDRGKLVPFRDSEAIAREMLFLLDNEHELNAMRKRAYNHCRQMVWKRTAQDYLDLFNEATSAWIEDHSQVKLAPKPRRKEKFDLPELDLRHLYAMTDDTSIFQHAKFTIPDRDHGYCVDDNCRALIATAMHWDLNHDESILPLLKTYLAFMHHALDEETGRFRNFMGYDRRWLEDAGSEDSHGRSLWSLGVAVALCPHESQIALATRLFMGGLGVTEKFTSPRPWAFSLCGIANYLRRFGGDSEVRRYRSLLADKLLTEFQQCSSDDWPWLEDEVAYANAKLPHALITAGKWMQRGDMMDMGKRALHWLWEIQTNEQGFFSPVGSNGWYRRGGEKAQFDQQCIEAHAMVDACIEAYHCTREEHWIDKATRAFYWFLGENDLRTPLYDFTTGGCRDGLHPDSVNENQGAESTLAWLMSLLLMQDLSMELSLAEIPTDTPAEKAVRKPISPSGPVVTARSDNG
ncbi:MAG: glycosyltransferase [Planctomycetes bacterium]|jgi:glycosyltransferase involved in cell wall biosynthesis|nr:glycosyltransferase family 4 protein [Phycisphaerae bacterium]NBB95323.1 glycosyltransferase [Planctomycetota bacterium]